MKKTASVKVDVEIVRKMNILKIWQEACGSRPLVSPSLLKAFTANPLVHLSMSVIGNKGGILMAQALAPQAHISLIAAKTSAWVKNKPACLLADGFSIAAVTKRHGKNYPYLSLLILYHQLVDECHY